MHLEILKKKVHQSERVSFKDALMSSSYRDYRAKISANDKFTAVKCKYKNSGKCNKLFSYKHDDLFKNFD